METKGTLTRIPLEAVEMTRAAILTRVSEADVALGEDLWISIAW